MKTRLAFVILLAGILFPFEWLSGLSLAYASIFDRVFATTWSHVLMHGALFAGLALCVMGLLVGRPRRRGRLIVVGVLIGAAFGQEAFQHISRGVWPAADTLFDLVVDMVGGGLGWAAASAFVARRNVDAQSDARKGMF